MDTHKDMIQMVNEYPSGAGKLIDSLDLLREDETSGHHTDTTSRAHSVLLLLLLALRGKTLGNEEGSKKRKQVERNH
eukprot:scaffold11860_cov54-Cylindrotheca_fusiformis.AAC.2